MHDFVQGCSNSIANELELLLNHWYDAYIWSYVLDVMDLSSQQQGEGCSLVLERYAEVQGYPVPLHRGWGESGWGQSQDGSQSAGNERGWLPVWVEWLLLQCPCNQEAVYSSSAAGPVKMIKIDKSMYFGNRDDTPRHQITTQCTYMAKELWNRFWIMKLSQYLSRYSLGAQSGHWFNIKMLSYQYRNSHCGDQTILWPSYLHIGISYIGKATSLSF